MQSTKSKIEIQQELENNYNCQKDIILRIIEADDDLQQMAQDIEEVLFATLDEEIVDIPESKNFEYVTKTITVNLMTMLFKNPLNTVQAMVGSIISKLDKDMDKPDQIDAATKIVEALAGLELFYVQNTVKGVNLLTSFELDEETMREVTRATTLLPSIIPYRKITHNYSPYYQLINTGSMILGLNGKKHHDRPLCYDFFNMVNRTRYSLNTDFIDTYEYFKAFKGVKEAYREREKKLFDRYKQQQAEVFDVMRENGNVFFLAHQPDTRGRFYCNNDFISYQKDAYHKAVVDFADKEVMSGF